MCATRWRTSACRRFPCFSCRARRSWRTSVVWRRDRGGRIARRCLVWTRSPATIISGRCWTRSVPTTFIRSSPRWWRNWSDRAAWRLSASLAATCWSPWTAPNITCRARFIASSARPASAARTGPSTSTRWCRRRSWRPITIGWCRWSRNSSCPRTAMRSRTVKAGRLAGAPWPAPRPAEADLSGRRPVLPSADLRGGAGGGWALPVRVQAVVPPDDRGISYRRRSADPDPQGQARARALRLPLPLAFGRPAARRCRRPDRQLADDRDRQCRRHRHIPQQLHHRSARRPRHGGRTGRLWPGALEDRERKLQCSEEQRIQSRTQLWAWGSQSFRRVRLPEPARFRLPYRLRSGRRSLAQGDGEDGGGFFENLRSITTFLIFPTWDDLLATSQDPRLLPSKHHEIPSRCPI